MSSVLTNVCSLRQIHRSMIKGAKKNIHKNQSGSWGFTETTLRLCHTGINSNMNGGKNTPLDKQCHYVTSVNFKVPFVSWKNMIFCSATETGAEVFVHNAITKCKAQRVCHSGFHTSWNVFAEVDDLLAESGSAAHYILCTCYIHLAKCMRERGQFLFTHRTVTCHRQDK